MTDMFERLVQAAANAARPTDGLIAWTRTGHVGTGADLSEADADVQNELGLRLLGAGIAAELPADEPRPLVLSDSFMRNKLDLSGLVHLSSDELNHGPRLADIVLMIHRTSGDATWLIWPSTLVETQAAEAAGFAPASGPRPTDDPWARPPWWKSLSQIDPDDGALIVPAARMNDLFHAAVTRGSSRSLAMLPSHTSDLPDGVRSPAAVLIGLALDGERSAFEHLFTEIGEDLDVLGLRDAMTDLDGEARRALAELLLRRVDASDLVVGEGRNAESHWYEHLFQPDDLPDGEIADQCLAILAKLNPNPLYERATFPDPRAVADDLARQTMQDRRDWLQRFQELDPSDSNSSFLDEVGTLVNLGR